MKNQEVITIDGLFQKKTLSQFSISLHSLSTTHIILYSLGN